MSETHNGVVATGSPDGQVVIYEIDVDDRYAPFMRRRDPRTLLHQGALLEVVADLFEEQSDNAQTHHAPPKSGDYPDADPLSIKVEDSETTYVIKLGTGTRAAFGPGSHPIMILPFMQGRKLLDDIGLIYPDPANGNRPTFLPAEGIGSVFAKVPKDAVLTFRCSRATLQAEWDRVVGKAGHPEAPLRIPFFLNLFDLKTGLPVWTYDKNRYHKHEHVDAGDFNWRVHGGIHPGNVTQWLY